MMILSYVPLTPFFKGAISSPNLLAAREEDQNRNPRPAAILTPE